MAHKLNLRKLPTYSALNFLKNMLPNFRDYYQLIGKIIYFVFPSNRMKPGGHFVSSTHHQFKMTHHITHAVYPFDQHNIGILPIFHHTMHDVSYIGNESRETQTRYELSSAGAQRNLLVKVKLSAVQCMMHVVSFRQQIVVT